MNEGAAAEIHHEEPRRGIEFELVGRAGVLLLNLGGDTPFYEAALADRRYVGGMARGDFTFVPEGERLRGLYRGPSISYLQLVVPRARLDALAEETRGSSDWWTEPLLMKRDALVHATGERIARGLADADPLERLVSDAALDAMLLHLASGSLRTTPPSRARSFEPVVARRLRDAIESDLAGRLTIEALAALAGTGRTTFVAAFRETFGTSVARFVRDARWNRAVVLLVHTARPIADIAIEAGYVDQSHLGRVCRARAGRTARQIRAQGFFTERENLR